MGLLSAAAYAEEPPKPEIIVLKAARLFDGKGDNVVSGAVIVVEGHTIRAIGANTPVPEGAKVLDLGDVTLLPGFIDAHVHLTEESGDRKSTRLNSSH